MADAVATNGAVAADCRSRSIGACGRDLTQGLESAARAFHARTMPNGVSDPVFFDAVLRPNPPLGTRALLAILAVVAIINFAFGVSFMLHGAWPIAPFMGADVALLGWAFWTSRKVARQSEQLTLRSSELRIARDSAAGKHSEVTFNPYWVRVDLRDGSPAERRLMLCSHGRSVQVGSFLAPQDQASLADALNIALRMARESRPH